VQKSAGPRVVGLIAIVVTAVAIAPKPTRAQTPIAGDSIHASRTLFTWRDPMLAATFVGLTFALLPADQRIASRLQDSTTQANRFFANSTRVVERIADPGAALIGIGMYGVGRLGHWKNVADLGLHGTEAVVLGAVITTLTKDIAGRARPYVSADTSPHDFGLFRGFHRGDGYRSFPSGHSTVAFAAAAAVTSESQRWWPRRTWIVAPVMYGGASLVALSRMYNNKHWASDVVLGAAVGTFSGIKVVRYTHGHTDNRLDRALLGVRVIPLTGGQLGLGWTNEVHRGDRTR
jgi:membrane-associated phospholipid phosphatase